MIMGRNVVLLSLLVLLVLAACNPGRKVQQTLMPEPEPENFFLGFWKLNSVRLGSNPDNLIAPEQYDMFYFFVNDSIMKTKDNLAGIVVEGKYYIEGKQMIWIAPDGKKDYHDILRIATDTIDLFKVENNLPVYFSLVRSSPY
jgi:hypothetical protein